MIVIVGLGNPGLEYANTRHNAGILLVDQLSVKQLSSYGWRRQYGILVYKTKDMMLAKSADYFMNESNQLLRDLAKIITVNPKNLYLAHDDLDLKLGEYKIQFGKGPKVHNGVDTIEGSLGTKDFWRVRIGVDSRRPENRMAGEQFVLQNFSRPEKQVLDTVLETAADAIVETTHSK